MKNKLLNLLMLSLISTAFIRPVQALENSHIVNPEDKPVIIRLDDSNEFEELKKKHTEEIYHVMKSKSSIKSLDTLFEKQKKEILEFDNRINHLRNTYTKDELLNMGYTRVQINAIENFDGTDTMRARSAAISNSWIQINANYYSNTKSHLKYDYIVEFKGTSVLMGAGGTISVGTGIKSMGYYQRQTSSISALYTSNGIKTGGNKTYRYPGFKESSGNTVTYVLPGTELLNNGDYVYLSRFSLSFYGMAQGNHTVNNILAGAARKGISISGVGISFSGSGAGLSLSFKMGWKNINKIDIKANR